jgi:crotonobetainyl-CoA:carnitine CoA-transferase CaiB-like acyl-CoA transferase
MNVPYLQYAYGGITPARSGLQHPTIAPYGAFKCAQEKQLLLSIQNEREWVNFCEKVLEMPKIASHLEYNSNILRVKNRVALEAIITSVFEKLPRDNVMQRLEAASIAYGRVSNLEDLKNHPQNKYIKVQGEKGEIAMLAPPAIINRETPNLGAVPAIGEHSDMIRAEFA